MLGGLVICPLSPLTITKAITREVPSISGQLQEGAEVGTSLWAFVIQLVKEVGLSIVSIHQDFSDPLTWAHNCWVKVNINLQ